MEQLDAERAQAFELPEGTVQDMPQSYEIATPEALCAFSKAQFCYGHRTSLPRRFAGC